MIRTEPAVHTAARGPAGGARIRALIALPSPLAPLSRLLQPFAPAWVQDAWPRAAQSRLTHCLLLALLLHVWLVLMLGNAPPGTASPGQGVWGALNVTLRGPTQDAPVAVATPPTQPAGLPGTAASPRAGGTVRAPSAQPLPGPGAARLGDWAPTPAPGFDAPALAEPLPEPIRLPPPLVPPPPEPLAAPAPPAPPAERRLGAALSSSTTAARAAPLERVIPAPPAAARLPLPPPLPEAKALTPLPTVPAPPAVPTALPAVAPPAPPAAAPPVEPVPSAPVLRQVTPLAAAAAPPASALAPVQALPTQAPVGLPALPAAPTGQLALPAGRPDAGPQAGHDVATAPSAPASAPRLNLELARPRGGELSRQAGAGGVLPLLPRPPELPDKLARDIDKAAKADCRKAYQGMGVLAVVPLAVDAVRGGKDSGCKW